MSALISKDIVDLQDIEQVQFLQTLQADPAKYQAYVGERTGRILGEVVDSKRASFAKVYGDLGRYLDMDHNSLAALDHTSDLSATQDQIIREQAQVQQSKRSAIDQTRRQVEINNWYFENKRETLFVLQFTLLMVLSVVVFLALETYGFLPSAMANYLIAFVLVVGVLVVVYNWYYTNWLRDPRYWNVRRFGDDGKRDPRGSGEYCIGVSERGRPSSSSMAHM